MGELLGSFPKSLRVRTKHVEKTRVGLWGKSAMLKVVWDVTILMLFFFVPSVEECIEASIHVLLLLLHTETTTMKFLKTSITSDFALIK
jgi:hypothetical protein